MPKPQCPEVAYLVRAARALRKAGVLKARWSSEGAAVELELTPQSAERTNVVALPKPRKLTPEQVERLERQRMQLRAEAEVYGRIVGDV